jgi:hypothetical protein
MQRQHSVNILKSVVCPDVVRLLPSLLLLSIPICTAIIIHGDWCSFFECCCNATGSQLFVCMLAPGP